MSTERDAKTEQQELGTTVLRRDSFLKAAGALGGAATVLPLAESLVTESGSAAAPPSGMVTTGSHFGLFGGTPSGHGLRALRAIAPDTHPPAMLRGEVERVFSPTRVKYPMVRRGFLEKGHASDTSKRGKDDFVRVSWDTALDLVANEIKRVRKQHGSHAIFAGSYGWKSPGSLHDAVTLLHRLLNGYGGYVGHVGDYSTAAAQRILPHVVGSLQVYEQQTTWPVVLKNTRMIVLWGADLVQNNKIDWVTPDHYVYDALPKVKQAGIRVVSINPYRTDTDQTLGAEWHPIKPGTDLAVMLAMAHVLIEEKLADHAFLARYTVGFDTFTPYVLGATDGVAKTPRWAEGISGIPAATIAQLARDMAHNRTMIMAGWAIQRQDHGEQMHWMLVTLAAMLGQIGLPGGGFGFSYHYCSGGAPTSTGPGLGGISAQLTKTKLPSGPAWLQSGTELAIPVTRWVDMLLNPGKTIRFDGQKITYPAIKMVMWAGGNPFSHHQNMNRGLKAWRRPETIVVNEISWTATARHADIVLPVTTTLERNDISAIGSYSNIGYIAMKQMFAPVGESRSDYAIYSGIAQRLGFEAAYTEGGRTELQWIENFYTTARKAGAAKGVKMPTFAAFWKKGLLEFPVSAEASNYVTFADFRDDPDTNPLSTPSGKIEIYSKTVAGFKYKECPGHPTWMEPVEWPGSPRATTYPLALISPHPKYRLHSQLDNTPMEQQESKIAGRAPVWINTHDAARRGITTGAVVRVFNARGQVLGGAIVTDRLLKGVARMEEGSWFDPLHAGQIGSIDIQGNPNTLTLDKGTSELAQAESANSCQVQIELYTAAAMPSTVYKPPKTHGG